MIHLSVDSLCEYNTFISDVSIVRQCMPVTILRSKACGHGTWTQWHVPRGTKLWEQERLEVLSQFWDRFSDRSSVHFGLFRTRCSGLLKLCITEKRCAELRDSLSNVCYPPRKNTADVDILCWEPAASKRFFLPILKPVVGQNIAKYAFPTARSSAFLDSAFPVHSTSFFPTVFKLKVTCNMNNE